MTTDLQVSAPPVEAERTAGGGPLSVLRLPAWPARVWAEHFSLLLALVVWALPVTRATGGREDGVLAVGLAACVPGLLLVLPRAVADRRVRGRTVGLALLLPAAALVVCLTAPTGWMGGSEIAACAYAPLLALLVFAYCSSPGRRLTVATMIGLAGLAQFAEAWVPWWGGGVSGRAMIGTFYWHNQFAAFLLPPAVIGLALALWRVPPVRAVGWVVTPLCAAGVVLSTSRAALAALIGGWVVVGSLAVFARADRRRVLVRFAGVSVLAVLVTVVLCSPPFLDQFRSPFAGTQARAQGQSLSQNGGYRLEFWQQSVAVFRHWPLSGAGFHSLGTAASPFTPADWARSPWAHNGYLQAFSDGGLVLGLSVLLLTGLAIFLCVRPLWVLVWWDRRRRRCSGEGPGPLAAEGWLAASAPVALLLLLVHSLVDFDWGYPALFAEAGVMFGLVAALLRREARAGPASADPVPGDPGTPAGPVRPWVVWTLTAACLASACLAAAADVVRKQDVVASNAAHATPSTLRAAALAAALQRPLADYQPARTILATAAGDPAAVPRQVVVDALGQTARAAEAVPSLQLLRARVQAEVLGEKGEALTTAGPLIAEIGGRPAFALDAAGVLVSAGQPAAARDVLARALAQEPAGTSLHEAMQSALRLGG